MLPEPVIVPEAETLELGVPEGGRLPDGVRDSEGVALTLTLPLCVQLADGVCVALTLTEGVTELLDVCM